MICWDTFPGDHCRQHTSLLFSSFWALRCQAAPVNVSQQLQEVCWMLPCHALPRQGREMGDAVTAASTCVSAGAGSTGCPQVCWHPGTVLCLCRVPLWLGILMGRRNGVERSSQKRNGFWLVLFGLKLFTNDKNKLKKKAPYSFFSCCPVSMSAWVSELCWAYGTELGECTWGLLGDPQGNLLPPPYCLFCPSASLPKLHYEQLLHVTCTLYVTMAGVVWIHHRNDSPCSQNPRSSFFWQGQWPIAPREGWCSYCFSSSNTSISIFPVTVPGCTHTSSIVFTQISSSYTG